MRASRASAATLGRRWEEIHHNMLSDAPRILISRMSAVGDTILTLPVACALRRHFPNAYLGWVVESKAASVVADHDCLDEVIVLDRGWFTSPRGIADARRRLRRARFEVAVDCQSLTKSSVAGWLAGARLRIGSRGKHGCELSPFLNNALLRPTETHLAARSLELLCQLGIVKPDIEWRFPIGVAARRKARELAEVGQLAAGYVVINPGATWNSRLWDMERFGAVARHLGDRHRLSSLVVWGNDRDHQLAEQIVASSGGHGVLAPPTDLHELAAVIERGQLFISSDTGPLHLAVAVGTPSISLHGVTRPEDSGPFGDGHIAIQAQYDAGTRRQRRSADNRAMLQITPEMVCLACDTQYDVTRRRAAKGDDAA
jgi:heptosyltransferase-1